MASIALAFILNLLPSATHAKDPSCHSGRSELSGISYTSCGGRRVASWDDQGNWHAYLSDGTVVIGDRYGETERVSNL